MKTISFDAVVIGTGAAGYNAADSLYNFGVKNICIVTENINYGTSRNTGSDKQTYYKLSLAGDSMDSINSMAETLFDGGAVDYDVALAEAAGSVRGFLKLANLGIPFPTNEYGEFVGYKTDHDPFCRATSIGPYTSKAMTEYLEKEVIRKNIKIFDKHKAVKIIVTNNEVKGLISIDEHGGYVTILTNNIIMATGGPAGIYFDSVYPISHLGSSSLAYDSGAEFANMAEWQYGLASIDFRWNVSGTYQQVLPRYISVDKEGHEKEFLLDYFPNKFDMVKAIFLKGYEWPFDVRKIHGSSYIDLLVYNETVIKGNEVYMDFLHNPSGLEEGFNKLDKVVYDYLNNSEALLPLPIDRLRKMNPGAISLYLEHHIDLDKEMLKVAVCAQHNNGGVDVNANWETCVKGLYVAGEAAGTFGVFRPGGSALNSSQVGSFRAAEHIAFKPKENTSSISEELINKNIANIDEIVKKCKGNKSNLLSKRIEYQKFMSENFAFIRNVKNMEKAFETIKANLANFTSDNVYKDDYEITSLFENLDILKVQYLTAEAMILTAKEFGSRGSSFVITGSDFLARNPVKENEIGRTKRVIISNRENYIRDVRTIADKRELWFEKVWGEYRKKRGQ